MPDKRCSTCKYYEPAPIWRKGWCRNPLLYSPQQSHLVGEDDLDCDRGMGNYWEPIDGGPGGGGPGGPERQFNYNPDERYWTDYVRIALPVIGVILLLGLAWFW